MSIPKTQEVSISEISQEFTSSMNLLKAKQMPMSDLLLSSPYNGLEHLLNMSVVSDPSRLLALALVHLRPTTTEYTFQPYDKSFNWQEIIDLLPPDFFGMVTYTVN